MPVLEAPAEYLESSPEHSLQQELPILLAPPGPAALAQQLRQPAARFNLNALPQLQQQLQQQQQQQQLQQQPQLRRPLIRNNSYDRDVPIVEETQHFPAFVHLLPVVLPAPAPEPTLDELLRRVTQRTDLEHVESVRLRVISYTVSLSRLSLFLPRLQQLDLSGSVLSSLRDLGYGLLQLTHLNISNCGLNSFDGTGGLPAIRVLIADGNMIQRVGPLAELPQLSRLSARNNRISELGLLSFLGLCPLLVEVELRGNPVCRLPLYRPTLRRSMPALQMLDGQPFADEISGEQRNQPSITATAAEEEEHSSLSSEASSEAAESIARRRPATAPISVELNASQRGFSTIPTTPVAGSVLGLVRQRRRRSGHAWVSSSSSSSSSGSHYSSASAGSTRAPSISSCSSNNSLDAQSSSYAFNAQSTLD